MTWSTALKQALHGQSPECVLLDLDGTLIDSVPDLASAVDAMLLELGRPAAGVEHVSHWIGNGADWLIRRALSDGNEAVAATLAADRVAQARPLFDRAYLSALHHATGAYPGADEFLRACPCPMVLITNKPRLFTEPLLQSLGWSSYFALVLCADDLPEKKPSPMPLLHACAQLALKPEQAVMIGDSRNDILAAHAAGMASVAVSYGYNHGEDIALSQPTLLVSSLLELME
ncbi:MAG: phosphoglycolate phosphatase [Bacterioplanes sp.]|nr:phosphoglycolate phosphatase [Bacterioplanes sp.]